MPSVITDTNQMPEVLIAAEARYMPVSMIKECMYSGDEVIKKRKVITSFL